jgi:acetyl-CoA carboxylase carboxyltransferase component
MKQLIKKVVDKGSFFEQAKHFAKNMITAFARLGGMSVGIVANNPMFWRVAWTSTPRANAPVSCASATPSTFR